MTDEELGKFVRALLGSGSVQQAKVAELLGLTARPESPDAGKPWTPVLHTAEEIKR